MNKKINIGIWGVGNVGEATANLFEEKAHENINVIRYDKYKNIGSRSAIVEDADFLFLCLPTPMRIDGSICLDYIDNSIKDINSLTDKRKIIIIRSTAVSGSTDRLSEKYPKFDYVFCPEFLTERSANDDMLNTSRIVIGANSDTIYEAVKSIFYYAYGDKINYIKLTCTEAETLKYISNIFLTGQVMLANELYFICKKIGVNYDKIQDYLKFDGRIGTHRKVPGHDGDFGVGGRCLVKDPMAFIKLAEDNGYDPVILKTMMQFNDKIRIKKDWLDIPGAVEMNKNFKRSE